MFIGVYKGLHYLHCCDVMYGGTEEVRDCFKPRFTRPEVFWLPFTR